MLNQPSSPFHLNPLVAYFTVYIKFANIVLSFVRHENKVDAFRESHVRVEN